MKLILFKKIAVNENKGFQYHEIIGYDHNHLSNISGIKHNMSTNETKSFISKDQNSFKDKKF